MDILDTISTTISRLGFWGVALLMLLENVIPPIPSEVIMPLAGFAIYKGEMGWVSVISAGTVGTVLGASIWYYIGKFLGLNRIQHMADRYGKWVGISGGDVDKAQRWFFERSGFWAVGLGRLLPGVRTYISVPAGIAEMPLGQFLVCTTVGSLGWIGLLTLAGFWLGENYDRVASVLGPISKGIWLGFAVLILGWLLYRKLKANSGRESRD